jgi:hypothetical protein
MSEEPRRRLAHYKIEYPFHAIDATLYIYTQTVGTHEGAEKVERAQLASGIVQYLVRFDTIFVEIRLQALDTQLCLLQVRMPTTDDQLLRDLLDDIVQAHRNLIAETDKAETLLSPARTAREKTRRLFDLVKAVKDQHKGWSYSRVTTHINLQEGFEDITEENVWYVVRTIGKEEGWMWQPKTRKDS